MSAIPVVQQFLLLPYFLIVTLLLVPPQILPFDFGEEAINSGEIASTICSVHKGDLPMDINWYHNNKMLTVGDGVSVLRDKKMITLSIDSVSFEAAGNYTCLAKNRAGMASHTASLNVNGRYLNIVGSG